MKTLRKLCASFILAAAFTSLHTTSYGFLTTNNENSLFSSFLNSGSWNPFSWQWGSINKECLGDISNQLNTYNQRISGSWWGKNTLDQYGNVIREKITMQNTQLVDALKNTKEGIVSWLTNGRITWFENEGFKQASHEKIYSLLAEKEKSLKILKFLPKLTTRTQKVQQFIYDNLIVLKKIEEQGGPITSEEVSLVKELVQKKVNIIQLCQKEMGEASSPKYNGSWFTSAYNWFTGHTDTQKATELYKKLAQYDIIDNPEDIDMLKKQIPSPLTTNVVYPVYGTIKNSFVLPLYEQWSLYAATNPKTTYALTAVGGILATYIAYRTTKWSLKKMWGWTKGMLSQRSSGTTNNNNNQNNNQSLNIHINGGGNN